MKKFLVVILAGVLVFTTACNSAQFIAVLNEVTPAVTAILQIIALLENKPADTSLAAKVGSDVAALTKLYTDFAGADAISKPGIQTQINATFGVLNNDLGTILQLAQVSNLATQAKLTALVALITESVQIAQAFINPTPAARQGTLNAEALQSSFNSILVAKTGDRSVDTLTPKLKLHQHSKLVRTLSLGLAK